MRGIGYEELTLRIDAQDLTVSVCFTGLDNDNDALNFVAERYRYTHGSRSLPKLIKKFFLLCSHQTSQICHQSVQAHLSFQLLIRT